MTDTICALSTPWGKSALGLIRISGPEALQIGEELTSKKFEDRSPLLVTLKTAKGELLDEAVTTFFQNPRSFTGEDMLEISAHGNPSILRSILAEIVSRGTRLAEPGEFTRRALANGRLSIDQVESLDWILNAQTMEGARLGLKAKISGLGASVEDVSGELQEILIQFQSHLDFSEGEVGELKAEKASELLRSVLYKLRNWSAAFEKQHYLLNRWTIVIAGPANSGKSSLFNHLSQSEKAIVYDQPGTTRDALEAPVDLNGIPVLLIDTAGVRETSDPIEKIGLERTVRSIQAADVVIWLSDTGELPTPEVQRASAGRLLYLVKSKADFKPAVREQKGVVTDEVLEVSVKTGFGLEKLVELILPESGNLELPADLSPLTSQRQVDCVKRAGDHLERAASLLKQREYFDLVTEEILKATRELEGIVDKIPAEGVLKQIFARFCIGK